VASKSKRIKFLKGISGTFLCGNVSEASIRRPVEHNFSCVGMLLQMLRQERFWMSCRFNYNAGIEKVQGRKQNIRAEVDDG
jgi:hypothetical protein